MRQERIKKIIDLLLNSKKSYKEIAQECECSLGTINYWVKRIKKSDIKLPPRKKGFKALSIKELL